MVKEMTRIYRHPTISKEKRIEKIAERLAISPDLRIPRSDADFCRQIGASMTTYLTDKKVIEAEWAKGDTPDEVIAIMSRLKELAMSGKNPAYMKYLMEIKGIYKDKSEVKIDLSITPDEFIKRNIRAESELTMEGYRVEEMSPEPPILSEKLRLRSGQDNTSDSKMDTLESLSSSSESSSRLDEPTES